MKPFFTDKGTSRNSTNLIEGSKIIVEDMEIAETLNTHFEYVVSSLGISKPKEFIISHENLTLFAMGGGGGGCSWSTPPPPC